MNNMNDLYRKIAELPPEKRELFELMLQEQGVDLSRIIISPVSRHETKRFPLSFSQKRLWFLDRLEPGSYLYHINTAVKLSGKLDSEALQRTLNTIISRHEVLRTRFEEENGEPFQVIEDTGITLSESDLSSLAEDSKEDELYRKILTESQKPFELNTGPLIRAFLYKINENNHVFFISVHHIVSDNWSTGLLVNEIITLYAAYTRNIEPALPQLPIQYADFASWQHKWLKGKTLENQLDFWKEELSGAPPLIEMPLDHPRPSFQTYNGDYLLFDIDSQRARRIRERARKQDVSEFMYLLAVFNVLLYKYSGQDDICVGTPVANRNRAETENLIGFFINTLVIRADLSGNPGFSDFLQRVKHRTLGAFDHQDIPFETLVETLHPERNMSHTPLFQVMFVLNNAPMRALEMEDLTIELMEIENKTSKFDLIFNITVTKDGFDGKLEFNTDLFDRATMERFESHFSLLLNRLLEDDSKLLSEYSLISDGDLEVLEKWRSGATYEQDGIVLDRISAQASKTPDAIAVRVMDIQLTYAELETQSNRLAHYLHNAGLQQDQVVGVSLPRSSELIISLLAIWKAGGVYLPLDPNYPAERLAYMLEDAGASVLLTESKLSDPVAKSDMNRIDLDTVRQKIDKQSDRRPDTHPAADRVAYIIYTSGTTGRPKGVYVKHRAFLNHCLDMLTHFELNENDAVLQFAAYNFDASLEQMIPTLMTGATLVLRDDEIWPTSGFHKKVSHYGLTVINPPTAYWADLAREWHRHPENAPYRQIRLCIVGGDVLAPAALRLWHRSPMRDVRILNAYGPTEAVITATTFDIPVDFGEQNQRVPIGRPRANRRIRIIDSHGQPVPPGIPGEMLIGGTALSEGYLNQSELTDRYFTYTDDFDGKQGRFYRTGDLVKYDHQGNIIFLGRVDEQVKIRGFRIELPEIEHHVKEHPVVSDALVSVHSRESGDKQLICHVICPDNQNVHTQELSAFLQKRLPAYMIPVAFIPTDNWPVSPTGKIDRRKLPVPDNLFEADAADYVAPRTETEQKLAGIIGEVLDIPKVGVHESFFRLGGHSMQGTRVLSQIRDTFNVELPLRTIFENPTIEGIARAITEMQAVETDNEKLESFLDEIENLSDDEISRLLDE